MTLYSILFYLISALIVTATGMAVTRRNMVHAVLYLVLSFFGTAMLFYLLGAPFLAALEIIIYAGAIMILFLFIIMMIKVTEKSGGLFPLRQWLPAAGIGAGFLMALGVLVNHGGEQPMPTAQAPPKEFGLYLYQNHWLSIEIASMLLLIALVGALYLGQRIRTQRTAGQKETP